MRDGCDEWIRGLRNGEKVGLSPLTAISLLRNVSATAIVVFLWVVFLRSWVFGPDASVGGAAFAILLLGIASAMMLWLWGLSLFSAVRLADDHMEYWDWRRGRHGISYASMMAVTCGDRGCEGAGSAWDMEVSYTSGDAAETTASWSPAAVKPGTLPRECVEAFADELARRSRLSRSNSIAATSSQGGDAKGWTRPDIADLAGRRCELPFKVGGPFSDLRAVTWDDHGLAITPHRGEPWTVAWESIDRVDRVTKPMPGVTVTARGQNKPLIVALFPSDAGALAFEAALEQHAPSLAAGQSGADHAP